MELKDDFAKAFHKLRSAAKECSDFGAWLDALKIKLVKEGVKPVLDRFKAKTSTGVCALQLSWLRSLPEFVLEEWKLIILLFVKDLTRPASANEVWLDLIVKKAACSRTVATFTSFWRVLMAVVAQNFRDWDNRVGESSDAAVTK